MATHPIPSTAQMSPTSTSSTSTQRNNQLAFFSAILLLVSAVIGVYLAYQDLVGNANVEVIP